MIELVYISKSRRNIEEQDIKNILCESRKNNSKMAITGLLLFDGVGLFIQALEGGRSHVESVYNKIFEDPRHHDIRLLHKKQISERSFSNWEMGFREITPYDLNGVAGVSTFLHANNKYKLINQDSSIALQLLDIYRKISI